MDAHCSPSKRYLYKYKARCYNRLYWWTVFISVFLLIDKVTSQSDTFTVLESDPPGTLVVSLQNHRFLDNTVLTPEYNVIQVRPPANSFSIDSTTGELRTAIELDYETQISYELVVTGGGGGYQQITVTVQDVNDNAPTFTESQKNVSISEMAEINKDIPLGNAVDADAGRFGVNHYAIISGNDEGIFNISFERRAHEVTLDLLLEKHLDYETTSSYHLVIRAYDGGVPPRTGDLDVYIQVLDGNDHQPVFSQSTYSARIPEDMSVGDSVIQVHADDVDSGDIGQVHYRINMERTENGEYFNIGQNTGLIRVQRTLDYERDPSYTLIVEAYNEDPANNRAATAVVSITLDNLNDEIPVFAEPYYFLASNRVPTSAQIGDPLARITVSDADDPRNEQPISFRLSGDGGYFNLTQEAVGSSHQVLVVLSRRLDDSSSQTFDLMITASDNGNPPLSSSQTITFIVGDSSPPQFARSLYQVRLPRYLPRGSYVEQVDAQDIVTYSLASPSRYFHIHHSNGIINTTRQLDCDLDMYTELVVLAADTGNPQLTGTTTVSVTVESENLNQPMFDQSFYNITVSEDELECIFTLTGSDNDCSSQLRYTVEDAEPFYIHDQYTGELCVLDGSGTGATPPPPGGTAGTTGTHVLDYETTQQYQFTAIITDHGTPELSSSALVLVSILDVNDNAPVFRPTHYTVSISPDQPLHNTIVTVQASDADSGTYGTITYTIQEVDSGAEGLFRIDHTTGTISLASTLPTSQEQRYTLTVEATDGGNRRSDNPATVNIQLIDRQTSRQTPQFGRLLYTYEMREDANTNHVVGAVDATIEAPGSGSIEYSIVSAEPPGYFSISTTSGEIRLTRQLSYNLVSSVLINVQATGPSNQRATTQVEVVILDINDHSPEFAQNSVTINIKEELPVSTMIYVATARDLDSGRNGRVRYTMRDDSQYFEVLSTSGQVRIKQSPDYEVVHSEQLRIVATDQGDPTRRSATLTLTVNIQDINDEHPQFTHAPYRFHLLESAAIGSEVGAVTAEDLDSGQNAQLVYVLRSHSDVFGIHRDTGVLYTRAALNHTLTPSYTVQVAAVDNGAPSLENVTTVHVEVQDSSRIRPVFSQPSYRFAVAENRHSGAAVGQVVATQARGPAVQLRYTIANPGAVPFIMDTVTGAISTTRQLNRETKDSYSFVVTATAGVEYQLSSSVQVVVHVQDTNDHSPVFDDISTIQITEEQPKGTLITTLTAVDRDEGVNSKITFSISSQSSDGVFFSLNSHSGQLYSAKVFDFETDRHRYSFEVIATDSGNPPQVTTKRISIDITQVDDREPRQHERAVTFTVQENVDIGFIIGYARTSENRNQQITYHLDNDDGSTAFGVNPNTSAIYVQRPIDYEMAQAHAFAIRISDNTHDTSDVVHVYVTVADVNDNAPVFTETPVVVYMYENEPRGALVYRFNAHDQDSGNMGRVRYTMSSGEQGGVVAMAQLNQMLQLNRDSGELTLKQPLDFEQITQLSLYVEAEDMARDASTRQRSSVHCVINVIDLNDNSPVFQNRDQVSVIEDEPVGYPVLHLLASDLDRGDNGRVSYTLLSGDPHGYFSLDSNTGLLSIRTSLDRETIPSYTLLVQATDHGIHPQTQRSQLHIQVEDVNDNAPQFQQMHYTASVPENSDSGTSVVHVSATDPDIGENGALIYSIPSGLANNKFHIDAHTGYITTSVPLDREEQDTWTITVYVKDSAYPSRYDNAIVMVTVTDKNDNSPHFTHSVNNIQVPEEEAYPNLLSLLANDADTGINARVSYDIIAGNQEDHFRITPGSGTLSCVALDREQRDRYTLIIEARDGGRPARSSTCTVYVTVLDENDNQPVFEQSSYTQHIAEDIGMEQFVLQVTAQDADLGSNGNVSYYINNTDNGSFRVDNTTGVITTTGSFDRERRSQYTFVVYAIDGGLYGPRRASTTATIYIDDVNDNAPQFVHVPYTKTLLSNAPSGTEVIVVSASDADIGDNAAVTYRLSESSPNFGINRVTGRITTSRAAAAIGDGVHYVMVQATDGGNPSLTTTGVVEVHIGSSTSPGMVRFTQSTYTVHRLEEHSPIDTEVTTVQATAQNGARLMYEFVSGNEYQAFTINQNDGTIRVQDPDHIDYERSVHMYLTVTAHTVDRTASGYATVNITLVDINDNPPRFGQDRYTSAVWEDNPRGTYVTQVSASDVDTGYNGDIIYTILSGNDNSAFEIEPPESGIIKTRILIDREIQSSYRLIVEAIDNGEVPLSSTCTVRIDVIDVNDHGPNFPSTLNHTRVIREGVDIGSDVVQVTANDNDLHTNLVYSFLPDGNRDDAFAIDGITGQISVAAELDHEQRERYDLGVMVSDGEHNATLSFSIFIEDVNDNHPTFTKSNYQGYIDEDSAADTLVLTVSATDADSGNNARITYSLTIPTQQFYIDSHTGAIYTNETIAYGAAKHLVVQATDSGVPALMSVVPVRVYVRDVNDEAPRFTQQHYSEIVSESQPIGSTILRVEATDDDHTDPNNRTDFSIISGNNDERFQIISQTGELVLLGALDREDVSSYELIIEAKDRGSPPLATQATVMIDVQDVNDNAPVFAMTEYSARIDESIDSNTDTITILTVSADDRDYGTNARITYAIRSGNEDGLFSISAETGVVSARELNYEKKHMYVLNIEAYDNPENDSDRRTAVTTVTVNITDVNEYKPRFVQVVYLESVRITEPNNSVVFQANAHDEDGGEFGILTYELLADDRVAANEYFAVDHHTGIVRTRKPFTNDTVTPFRFIIRATDMGGMWADVEVSVIVYATVVIIFSNDTPDRFVVPGNAKVGDLVGQLQVISKMDGKPVTTATFQMISEVEYFGIGETTGIIYVAKDLQDTESEERRKRSVYNNRVKRALEEDIIQLEISARVNADPVIKTIEIALNRSCEGCALPVKDTGNFSGAPLAIVIVLAIIAVVAIVIVIILFLRRRERKRMQDEHNTSYSDTRDISPPDARDISDQIKNKNMFQSPAAEGCTMSEMSESSSSGRGSAEDEDREITMINTSSPANQHPMRKPDSGIQPDADNASPQSCKNHFDYLAKIGVDNDAVNKSIKAKQAAQQNKMLGGASSVESMHHFSDEGGGEADGLDINDIVYTNPADLQNVARHDQQHIQTLPSHYGISGGGGSHDDQDHNAHTSAALSSIINSEEELSGSYNWDYLLDWGPQYQPLADVFVEIAQLKDDNIVPKKQPTHIVPQPSSRTITKPKVNDPPPIITGAPPHAVLANSINAPVHQPLHQQDDGVVGGGIRPVPVPAHNGTAVHHVTNHSMPQHHIPYNDMPHTSIPPQAHHQHMLPHTGAGGGGGSSSSSSGGPSSTNSARTSQLTSFPSLPRSPISHESSYTSAAFSPSFTPNLTPLATRSPTISSLDSPKSTPSSKSRGRRHYDYNLHIPASSESEQEIRI